MAELLDFNRYRPPILPLVMPGTGLRLNLLPPSVNLLEELRASTGSLGELLKREDEEMVDVLFILASKLMSCNRQLKKITVEYIREDCGMDEVDLALFFDNYTNYLQELENAKN